MVLPPDYSEVSFTNKGDIVIKTKSKEKKFLQLDKLGQRIAHATRAIEKRRKERLERSYEKRLLQAI